MGTEYVDAGWDTVQASFNYVLGANLEALVLTGSSNLQGIGNAQFNRITGNAGDNLLDGKGGRDTLEGGLGNDIYVVDHVLDSGVEASLGGTDLTRAWVSHTLADNVENLTLKGMESINATGNTLSNLIIGNSGNNLINGMGGNDTLRGGEGDDTYVINASQLMEAYLYITGAVGNYVSGPGNTYFDNVYGNWSFLLQDRTGDGLVDFFTLTGSSLAGTFGMQLGTNMIPANLAVGTYLDAERASFASAGYPGLDFWMNGRGFNDVYGSFSIQDIAVDYSGSSPVMQQLDVTFSESGSLDGPALKGVLHYLAMPASAIIQEYAEGGTDLVKASIDYALGSNLENLSLTGTQAISGKGNALDNVLIGNGASNLLQGYNGDDTLKGGVGSDTLVGNTGNDTYFVDNPGDVVNEYVGEGTDTVNASVSFTLGANVENLVLTGLANINGTGNPMANTILGNGGNNMDLPVRWPHLPGGGLFPRWTHRILRRRYAYVHPRCRLRQSALHKP